MDQVLPYGYKAFTGVTLSDQTIDAINARTEQINQCRNAGRRPPDKLLKDRHALFTAAAMELDP